MYNHLIRNTDQISYSSYHRYKRLGNYNHAYGFFSFTFWTSDQARSWRRRATASLVLENSWTLSETTSGISGTLLIKCPVIPWQRFKKISRAIIIATKMFFKQRQEHNQRLLARASLHLWTWPVKGFRKRPRRSTGRSVSGWRWSCGANGARFWWEQTSFHRDTCYRKRPDRSGEYHLRGRGGYAQQRDQYPMIQHWSGDLTISTQELHQEILTQPPQQDTAGGYSVTAVSHGKKWWISGHCHRFPTHQPSCWLHKAAACSETSAAEQSWQYQGGWGPWRWRGAGRSPPKLQPSHCRRTPGVWQPPYSKEQKDSNQISTPQTQRTYSQFYYL